MGTIRMMTAGMAFALGVAAMAACGDDDATTKASPEAGATPPLVEAGAPDTSVPQIDAGDAGGDANGNEPAPRVLPLSPNGHDRLFGVTFDAAGNVFATGVRAAGTDAGDDYETVVAKLTPSGTLDATFGTAGVASVNLALGANGETTRGIVVQSTGKIVIAGTVERLAPVVTNDKDIALARFNANGTLDTTFGAAGILTLNLSDPDVGGTVFDSQWGLTLAANDKLVISGGLKATGRADSDFAVVRLDANGAYDATFGTNGVATIDIGGTNASSRGVNVLADGSIVAGGYMTDGDNVIRPVVFKLDPNGQPDTTFGTGGGIYNDIVLASQTEAYATATQGNKLVTTGYGRSSIAESLDVLSLRLTATGALDTTYGTNGLARIDVKGEQDQSRFVLVLPDNRVVLVGSTRQTATDSNGLVVVLTPDGKPDTTFAPKGFKIWDLATGTDFFWSAALSPDKKTIAIVGTAGAAAGGDDDAVVFMMPVPK